MLRSTNFYYCLLLSSDEKKPSESWTTESIINPTEDQNKILSITVALLSAILLTITLALVIASLIKTFK